MRPDGGRTALRFFVALLVAGFPLLARAGEPAAPTGILGVHGTAGASVSIDGRPIGEVPVESIVLPRGIHTIRLSKRGYETREERIWIGPERGESRVLYLREKRRQDALWRNLLVPGWGAYYTERPIHAAAVLFLEAAVLGYAYHQDGVFHDRKDDHENAALAYDRAVDDVAIAAARAERDRAYDRMASAETNRDRALLAAAVVYGLSALDVFFRFPYEHDPDAGRIALRTGFSEHGGAPVLALRITF